MDDLQQAIDIQQAVWDRCTIDWDVMHNLVLAKPKRKEWLSIANMFWDRCNLPNCIGVIDGKHIRILKNYFKSKKYFSFVSLAIVDENYCFRYIDLLLWELD